MVSIQEIQNLLTGEALTKALIAVMAEQIEDFAEDQKRCDEAVHTLRAECPEVGEEVNAIHRQITSLCLFSSFLGFKANLDHYIDPVARTFLDVDFKDYLREGTAKQMPEYINAQAIRKKFADSLSGDQRDTYEDIAVFANHLEVTVPKLAHFAGYMLGNALLPRIVPGYVPDYSLTVLYERMLADYFGKDVLIVQ